MRMIIFNVEKLFLQCSNTQFYSLLTFDHFYIRNKKAIGILKIIDILNRINEHEKCKSID